MSRGHQMRASVGAVSRCFLASLLILGFSGRNLTAGEQHAHQTESRLEHEHHNHGSEDSPAFHDVESQTAEFIEYFLTIQLTPEQQAARDRALGSLKAVCCDDFPMSDCCCVCNLSRSIWGLSSHLIVDLDYTERQVREAVQEWLAVVNPGGFSGDACHQQKCLAPLREDGCGGMDPAQIVTG